MIYTALCYLCAGLFWIFTRYRLVGVENIPKGTPAIICPNHTRLTDPFYVAFACLPHKIAFMAKKELFRVPMFAAVLRWVGLFPVNRGGTDISAIRTSKERLAEGKKLVIFPEGTRVTEENSGVRARAGAAMLAIREKVPVVPVLIRRCKKSFCRVEITFGKPISFPVEGKPGKSDYEAATAEIMGAIDGLRGELQA